MIDGVSSSLNGLNNATQRLAKSARNIATASQEGSDVNVAKELAGSKQASTLHTANAKALKAQLDAEKKLMDILA